jgi:beta-xylosidase
MAVMAVLAITPVTGATAPLASARTGSWGDQGDGTYKNPILNADYPDVDVEQVGDTYYMISSKQHMAPGMVILESKDMVNWTTLGHVWPKLSWAPEYNWDRMNGYSFGVWAGDLAHHDGTWYCYQIDAKHGLFMSSARDIRGPWTEPHKLLPAGKVLDDPAVFWDDEAKQAYLICNTGNKLRAPDNKTPGNENRIFKLSWDGRTILDEPGVLVYTGHGAEAAKICKINGTWYLFLVEWAGQPGKPAGDRKQIVLRSKTASIYGPYEKRVVLERGNGVERSCSQGALMRAPDGSWWFTHQLIQNIAAPFQGRPQCLEPVTWTDGWPIIGRDVDGDGIGEPVLQHRKPIAGFPVTAPPSGDEFAGAKLGLQWEWNHNPRDTHWSLTERPGWLRLKASRPVPDDRHPMKGDANTFWRACNTISQRIMGTTTGAGMAKLDIAGMKPGQRAGLVRFGGVYHLLGVHMDDSGKRCVFFRDNTGRDIPGPEIRQDVLFIRTANRGDRTSFEYSFDGKKFERCGPEFQVKFGRWTGDRLGFFCWNEKEETGHLDVDYFHYDYDGPKKAARPVQTAAFGGEDFEEAPLPVKQDHIQ